MGKKSKRRGGGTSNGARGRTKARGGTIGGDSNAGTLALVPASGAGTRKASTSETEEALALLENFRPLDSLKGIISTNNDPTKCAWCDGKIVFSQKSRSSFHVVCCGKRSCPSCCEKIVSNSCEIETHAPDLLGEKRCIFCNVLGREMNMALMGEAKSGKSWAQYLVAVKCIESDKHHLGTLEDAFNWLQRAAAQNHPESFWCLASMYLHGKGNCPRDLAIAKAYAKAVGTINTSMRLLCSQILIDIAEAYLSDGNKNEALTTVQDVIQDADEVDLDLDYCKRVVRVLFKAASNEAESFALMSRIHARYFRLGEIEYALLACLNHHKIGEFAFSKLWLEVALKTRRGFRGSVMLGGKKGCTWPDSEEQPKRIRSELREMRNACGGCGVALEGERRQYCRGCRAYCYCSKECQKLHWSRSDNGHRDECKEVQEEARKIWQAIEDGTLRMPEVGK